MALYDTGARITELVIHRELALALLERAGTDRYVTAAIKTLTDEPAAGASGGPARDLTQPGHSHPKKKMLASSLSAEHVCYTGGHGLAVAKAVAEGLDDRAIASQLSLTPSVVRGYLTDLCRRHELHNRAALAVWATHAVEAKSCCPATESSGTS